MPFRYFIIGGVFGHAGDLGTAPGGALVSRRPRGSGVQAGLVCPVGSVSLLGHRATELQSLRLDERASMY